MNTKSILITLFFMLFTQCVTLHVSDISPNVEVDSKVNAHIKNSGKMYFDNFSSQNWNNSIGDNYVNSSFKDFTGDTYIELEATKPLAINIEYSVTIKSGKLNIKVIDINNKVLWEEGFINETQNIEEIEFPLKGIYRIYFSGSKAKGKYKMQWY